MVENYTSPPLVEALCEFRFKNNDNWDWTIPGSFYEEIKREFPIKEQKNAVVIALKNNEGKIVPAQDFNNGKKDKLVFLNKEKNVIIQIGSNYFSINLLSPYPGWETFKNLIDKYEKLYLDISRSEVERIGLRYINKFNDVTIEDNFKTYFNFGPQIPIKRPIRSFFIRNELLYEEINSILLLNMGVPPGRQQNKNIIVLDFDFITVDEDNAKNLNIWLDKAHNIIEEAFNSCITEKTKDFIRGEKAQ